MHRIELLAPAGSEDAFFAAIAAGADAIYFGTDRFNARERAENIKLERLPFLTQIAHAHNVRVYMTLNIVFYDDEFSQAVKLVGDALASGIDAVIVQDFGMISVLHRVFPELEIHASTQMTTHNLAQCQLLAESGVSQINLSRELSFEEIEPLAAFMQENNIVPEIFIHGAYCISYSGQCYFSGGLYGLPGNRGLCVQPCRREFRPIEQSDTPLLLAQSAGTQTLHGATIKKETNHTSNKKTHALTDGGFFTPFNLKDNCVFKDVRRLAESCGWKAGSVGKAGNIENGGAERPLCSFKIEGRIKSADYVFAVTSAWREQLDRLENGAPLPASDEKLSLSMNRGFSTGYLQSDIARKMFTSGKKDHSWRECGTVASFRADGGTLVFKRDASCKNCKNDALQQGDEIAIYEKTGSFVCNALVKEIQHSSGQSSAVIAINGKLNGKILPGQTILRIKHFLSDERLASLKKKLASDVDSLLKNVAATGVGADSLRTNSAADSRKTRTCADGVTMSLCGAGAGADSATMIDRTAEGKTAVYVRVSGKLDGLLETEWSIRGKETRKNSPDATTTDTTAYTVTVRSDTRLSEAQKRSLDSETLTEKFGRLGGTPFVLAETDCTALAQNLFLPLGELNEIRRKAVAELAAAPQADNASQAAHQADSTPQAAPQGVSQAEPQGAPQADSASQSVPQADVSHPTTISIPHPVGKQANPKNFRTITLLYSPDEYTAHTGSSIATSAYSKTENTILALEIPVLFRDEARNEYISFLNAHPDVLPYFPAILFESDFNEAVSFLSELAHSAESPNVSLEARPLRTIICENAGLLAAAHDAGFSVIPGFHLNITNSYSAAEYCSRFKCPAVIPSPETTAEQLANMTLPENTELWILPEAKDFLMQSRQCLVGRASGCKKTATDRKCLEKCSRSVKLVGKQGESIIAEKRPGFYSRLQKG